MKLILVLILCGLVPAAPKVVTPSTSNDNGEDLSWIIDQAVNILVRQLIEYIRRLIKNGSEAMGIPVMDPLEVEKLNISVPAGLVNIELDLKNVYATGIGGFIVHRSRLTLSDLTFDLDISVPTLDVSAEHYDFTGYVFTAIPLYGAGRAVFKVDGLRLQAKAYLKQSEDGKAVIIDRIENTAYRVPFLKSQLTGVIGGGDIDAIVNAIIDQVIVDYVNRFQGYIASVVARMIPPTLNPTLEQLDTWKYIAPLLRPKYVISHSNITNK